jgi:bifunctional non-homologous end joining protein LigD
VVALDERGRASFERLQHRFRGEPAPRAEVDHPVVFYAFDALSAEGHDLRGLPLATRKDVLARFAPRAGFVRFADHVAGEGMALFEAARTHELEGIVAKRADSRYESGRRSDAWLKIKVPRSAPLAIVGWLPGKGNRGTIGSLLTAWQKDGTLTYAGAVGSGLDDATLARLGQRLGAARIAKPACAGVPKLASPVFTQPELVCEVRYTELTSSGAMRHPVFLRLRDDLAPDDCVLPGGGAPEPESEAPVSAAEDPPRPPREPELRLTRLDKVFWPVEGYTKGDLLGYYEAVWPWLGPYLRDRPLVLTRYPDGIDGKSFYQKNAPDFTPDWVTRQRIDDTDYFVCNELRTLLHVINSGAIPLHVWSARRDALERPAWLILDLDPKQAPFAHVVRIARHIHALLDELDARHFIKTSGQDGLHVLLPLGGALEHGDAVKVAEVLARVVCADLPEIATITRPVAARGDKVYVDYLQNGRGKLIAAPLSVRPRPHAPVSMPLAWRRVDARLDPAKFTIQTAPRELAKGGDPFADVLGPGVDPVALLGALAERLAAASSSPRTRTRSPSRRTP